MDFTAIIEMVNILYVFAEVIEFSAFIKLRHMRRAAVATRTNMRGAVISRDSMPQGGHLAHIEDIGANSHSFDALPCTKSPIQDALVFAPACAFLLAIVLLSNVQSWAAATLSLSSTALLYVVTAAARAHGW